VKGGVIEIERKIKILMISTVLVLAVLSGIALLAYANANGATNDTSTTNNGPWYYSGQYCNVTRPFFGQHAFAGGWGGFGGRFINVSQEYKDNVINIIESNSTVKNLLNEGYNITGVRPIISATVEADGTVTMKATTAIVSLKQGTTGRALVWVDIEQAKVTRIEILTRTVIE
jgi:hypothetical protein